jgi:hypothetical protein
MHTHLRRALAVTAAGALAAAALAGPALAQPVSAIIAVL